MTEKVTLIHYGELALKGKNRRDFENQLIRNIKAAGGGEVLRFHDRLALKGGSTARPGTVPGIAWYSNALMLDKNVDALVDTLKNLLLDEVKSRIDGKKTFGVFVNRADKSFPLNSMELAKNLGRPVKQTYGLTVDLENPDLPIYVEIADKAFVYFEKVRGLGGLPVGVSGKFLCLFSGGIDSSVAAFLMLKRGGRVDYLHFHVFPQNEAVLKTKIKDLMRILAKYQPKSKIHLAPYHPFQFGIGSKIPKGYELIIFRRFMLRVAQKIAQNRGYQAVIIGDSLGQVASQTIENLAALDKIATLPIFRPLIGFDKQEIIDRAKEIGTYDTAIRDYKDCCSIVSRRPKTKARLEIIEGAEEEIAIAKLTEETLTLVDSYDVASL
jgi:thiamine biosynthesis protein ThiI